MKKSKLARFLGFGIKNTRPIFKTEILICQSKANIDMKLLFGKITRLLDQEMRKNACKGFVLERKFHVPFWPIIQLPLNFESHFLN